MVLVLGIGRVICDILFLVLAPAVVEGKSRYSLMLKFIFPLYDLQKKIISFSSLLKLSGKRLHALSLFSYVMYPGSVLYGLFVMKFVAIRWTFSTACMVSLSVGLHITELYSRIDLTIEI